MIHIYLSEETIVILNLVYLSENAIILIDEAIEKVDCYRTDNIIRGNNLYLLLHALTNSFDIYIS